MCVYIYLRTFVIVCAHCSYCKKKSAALLPPARASGFENADDVQCGPLPPSSAVSSSSFFGLSTTEGKKWKAPPAPSVVRVYYYSIVCHPLLLRCLCPDTKGSVNLRGGRRGTHNGNNV